MAEREIPLSFAPADYIDSITCQPQDAQAWREAIKGTHGNGYGNGFHPLHMQTHWYGCQQLIQEAERRRGVAYDFVVWQRPDYYWMADAPPLQFLLGRHTAHMFIDPKCPYCDQMLMGDRNSMMKVLGWLKDLGSMSELARILTSLYPGHNAESIVWSIIFHNRIETVPLPGVGGIHGVMRNKDTMEFGMGRWIARCGWSRIIFKQYCTVDPRKYPILQEIGEKHWGTHVTFRGLEADNMRLLQAVQLDNRRGDCAAFVAARDCKGQSSDNACIVVLQSQQGVQAGVLSLD